jgi:hypothetical protein
MPSVLAGKEVAVVAHDDADRRRHQVAGAAEHVAQHEPAERYREP